MFCSFITKVIAVSLLMAMPSACSWFKNHPQQVDAIEKDLEDVAENLMPGCARAPSPFAP